MGAESDKAGIEFEKKIELLFKKHKLKYIRKYEALTITGKRAIDFVIITKIGKVLVEAKYRDVNGENASHRYASMGLFIVMYEYKLLFPGEQLLAIVNDLSILKPGQQNYISLLASLGVEVVAFDKSGKPNKLLDRKLKELARIK